MLGVGIRLGLGIGLVIRLGSGLGLRIGLGMWLGIGLGSGFDYFRQYNDSLSIRKMLKMLQLSSILVLYLILNLILLLM